MIEAGKETYLGDGLYVSHDGYQIWLRADENRVALESAVWFCLLSWVKRHASPAFPAGIEGPSE
jgi:hypothetical protein